MFESNKYKKNIINVIFILTFTSIFILNNNQRSEVYYITRYINLIFTVIILSLILPMYSKIKLKYYEFFLLLMMIVSVIFTALFRGYINFHFIYMLAIILLSKTKVGVNKRIEKYVVILCCVSVFYQIYNNYITMGRYVTNWIDPNYSSYYIFLLFVYLRQMKFKKLSYIMLLLGALPISRSYFLAVIIYFIFDRFDIIKNVFVKLRLKSFFTLMFISLTVVLLIGYIFMNIETISISADIGVNKLFVLNDKSNEYRFSANHRFLESLKQNFTMYLWGVSKEDYISTVFMNQPHNSFLALIVNYGITFAFAFISLYGIVLNKIFSKKHIPIVVTQFTYFMFLGSGMQGFPGVLFFFILIYEKNNSNAQSIVMKEEV